MYIVVNKMVDICYIVVYLKRGRGGSDYSLCNQCLSPLALWVWIPLISRYTRYNIMW